MAMSPQDVGPRDIGAIDDSGRMDTPVNPVNMNEEAPSLGDEEFGSDEEEVEVGTNEVAAPDDGLESLDPFRQKKRARKFVAWKDFQDVVVGSEKTLMSECIHCQKKFMKTKTSTTTSLLRHMNVCQKRLAKLKKPKQQKINFPVGDSSTHSYLHTGQFDMAGMREAAAEWVLMHEHPFSIMEEDGLNLMLKRGMPEWKKN
ncbi:HAT family dimerisation domain containing protein [Striga asiatica]|uniref:HAT family dimerisation domain containing protein n=1 Tax=Striga asiatica TaxID=4170 RepID=A0A5A7PWI0_STRAF|nr:HAT family dimerisation domain containing protein [Striga asiatica]